MVDKGFIDNNNISFVKTPRHQTQVNNQPMPAFLGTAWQTAAWSNVQLTDVGTTYVFTLKDQTVRKLTAEEYF